MIKIDLMKVFFRKLIYGNKKYDNENLIKFMYEGSSYYVNNDKSAQYHIDNSIDKLNRMSDLILPGSKVIFDVGANCGIFSSFALRKELNCHVHAFEPSEFLLESIRRNCHDLHRLTINKCALSDHDGVGKIYINLDSQQTNSLNLKMVEPFAEKNRIISKKIDLNTIDGYCEMNNISSIDVLKLDVQGLENKILSGAKKMILNTNQLFLEAAWLEPETINLALQLREKFEYAYIVNSVYTGADILFMRSPLNCLNNNIICSI